MNLGTGNMTLQIPNPKQHYYAGDTINSRNSSSCGPIGQQHQVMDSTQVQIPINAQAHGQSRQSQSQAIPNPNGHNIRSPPSSSSSSVPINMSMNIPVTSSAIMTQQHPPDQQLVHQNQQMSSSNNSAMNLQINNSSNFRNQPVNIDLQQQQQQQHQGSNEYQHQVSNQNQNQLSGFSNSGHIQQQVPQNSNSTNVTLQQQQQHSIILNLGNLLDIDIDDRPHVCQVCQATYKTRTHLRRHMFIHLQNRPYPCGECSKGFNRKEHLNKHIEAVHSGTRYKCHLCGKEISRKDHLARHIKNMHNSDLNDPMVQAQMNPIQLTSSDSTLVSLVPSSLSSSPPKKLLQSQSSRVHRPSQDAISESENDEGVHFMIGDLPSSLTNKLTSEKILKIQESFNSSSMSIIDQLRFNPNEFFPTSPSSSPTSSSNNNKKMFNELYTCRECHAVFPLEKDLNIHLRVHKAQPYKCNQCPRAYTRREKLTEHIRCFHQGQKFSCEYCDKQLSRKDHVLRHVRSVHPEVLANRFVAIADNRALDSAANGSRHGGGINSRSSVNISSLGNNNNTNIPSMGSMGDMGILLRSVCHVCLKVFGTSYHLQRHCESCHNGDNRPFACNFCKKQFKRKDHLTKHVKSHCPSMKDTTTKSPRGSGSGGTRKASKNSSKRSAADAELSTIDQETINSLQIEMTTPDEDVEVAIAIVNTSNAEAKTNAATATITTSSTSSTSTKDLLNNLSLSPNSIIPPSSTSSSSSMSITATTINPKLPNSSSTYTRNLQEIINTANNNSNSKYRPSNIIARKSSVGSSMKNENKFAAAMAAMAVRTTADFTCGHCQAKFPTKEKMIHHLQSHPSTSSSSSSSSSGMPASVVNTSHSYAASTDVSSSGHHVSNSSSHSSHDAINSSNSSSILQSVSAAEVLELISTTTANSTSSSVNAGNSNSKSGMANPLMWT